MIITNISNSLDFLNASIRSHTSSEFTENQRKAISCCIFTSSSNSLFMPIDAGLSFRERRLTTHSAHISSKLTTVSVVIQYLDVSIFLSTRSFCESKRKNKSKVILETHLIRIFSRLEEHNFSLIILLINVEAVFVKRLQFLHVKFARL